MKNALALLTITIALHGQAQPACSTFDTGLDGWTADEATCRNVGGVVRCDDDSGGSNLVAPAGFLGNWVNQVGGCGSLCFDLNLIASGLAAGEQARLGIVITSGTQRATFRSPPISEGSGFQRFCAPIAETLDGQPPASDNGEWILAAGTSWNTLIANVTSLELPIDIITGNEERIEFDNVCFQPRSCPTPISCDTPSFSVQQHTLTPVGFDEVQSDLVLNVPGPYERITVTRVSASVRSAGDDCAGDLSFPLAAHFVNPQTAGAVTPLPGPPSPREITWTGGTAPLVPLGVRIRGTQVGLPAACPEELTFCFRYRVIGGNCDTCEQISCRTVLRP